MYARGKHRILIYVSLRCAVNIYAEASFQKTINLAGVFGSRNFTNYTLRITPMLCDFAII
jgi:hypothetical protein